MTGSGLFEKNSISAQSVTRATGVIVTGASSSFRNNLVSATLLAAGPAPTFGGVAHALRVNGSNANVHSNTLIAQPSSLSQSFELGGAVLEAGGATLRNNIVFAGVRELGPFSDPLAFENNLAGAYYDEGATNPLLGAAAINALTDMTVSGTIDGDPRFVNGYHLSSTSPCVGAGTPAGAPSDDLDGTPRTPPPDIGAYEWSAAKDPCYGVCENGTCSAPGDTAQCSCNGGFQHPPNQPLVCEDVNECGTNNGGCDPLTTCTNVPGGRTCSSCPPGYSGTGESGCVPTLYCAPNPCQHGAVCIEAHDTYACDCPPGITGHECTIVFDELSPGNDMTCAVRSDGALACWGINTMGAAEAPNGTFVAVAAGLNFGCAIRSDATLACWGQNDYGQATPPTGTFQAVSTADSHACALHTNGSVACWGNPANGRTTPPSGVFQTVSVEGNHSCALRPDASIACWGYNEFGQTQPPAGAFQAVEAGGYHTCALTTAGTPLCWGLFDHPVPSGTFSAIVTGGTYACALRTSGTIACWGNAFNPTSRLIIEGVPSGVFERLTGGPSHVCAIRSDDTVACWGHDGAGKAHPPGGVVSSLDAASNEVCVITTDGTIECWGRSLPPPSGPMNDVALAQQFTCGIGSNDVIACSGSVTPPGGPFRELSAGTSMACALRADGSVACFGSSPSAPEPSSLFEQISVGGSRACGVRTTAAVECWGPSAPTFTGAYRSVGVGPSHVCAIDTSGALECQGSNADGESTPPPGTFVDVVAGDNHACARRADGTVACWGQDSQGQASPPAGAFHSIAAGATHTCGVRPDLRVECWGSFFR